MNCAYDLGTALIFQENGPAKILKFEVKHQTSVEISKYSFHAQDIFEKLSYLCQILLISQGQKVLNTFCMLLVLTRLSQRYRV